MRVKAPRTSASGFAESIEILVLSVVLVLGSIVGLVSMRDSVNAELSDLSEAIGALNQGYTKLGAQNVAGTVAVAGSSFEDNFDNVNPPIDSGSGDSDDEIKYLFEALSSAG